MSIKDSTLEKEIKKETIEKEEIPKLEYVENSENIETTNKTNNAENTEKIENVENVNISKKIESNSYEFRPLSQTHPQKTRSDILAIFGIFVLTFIAILLIICLAFTIFNKKHSTIFSGIYIKGVDVSNLSKEEALQKVETSFSEQIPKEITLTHGDFTTSISSDELSIKFDLTSATEQAYEIGRGGSVFENNIMILKAKLSPINIDASLSIDEEQLKKSLEDISTKLPDTIVESSYYIEGSNLILTKGKTGNVVKIEESANIIKEYIKNLNLNNTNIELITESKNPSSLDIEQIHNELYKEAKDAYYTKDPFCVYPSENGVDFAISLEEAFALLEEDKEEYSIPLKVLYPKVTTNMIGTDAFPDLLSTYSTKYAVSNKNRTTNLILAANKINGTVIMPGETFSYNKVVGERTIAAGYKEAPIYVNGEVVDGLGGGICQITSTLYNAVVYANLEIVERSNHQFVPSYVTASRDATVVYGSIDFKFKNNRDYPIKLVCSVSNGVASFQIFGLKTGNDYQVEISSRITGTTSNAIYSEAYKILKQNGQIVSTTLLSRDTYKRH